jgi:hypothetical protein
MSRNDDEVPAVPPLRRSLRLHLPMRPAWRCRRCAGPWPCPPSKLGLLADFGRDRIALCQYLAGQYVHALDDLAALRPNAPTTDLYARFMGWPLER